jgi:phosphoglycolate phosphatase-like HAD superfamily hydrolase
LRSADLPAAESLAMDAVIFDFDGVVLESVEIKSDAFRALFRQHPEHLDSIVSLNERFGGLSRYVKFEMIYRDILDRPLYPDEARALGERFSEYCRDALRRCPFVPGALEVLRSLHGCTSLAVVSGTPVNELVSLMRDRDLVRYFGEIHGSPEDKPNAIRSMIRNYAWRPSRVVMIGDAMTDYDAAAETEILFVGRVPVGTKSPFPDGTLTISDLSALQNMLAQHFVESSQ